MKTLSFYKKMLLFSGFLSLAGASCAQNNANNTWTLKTAARWVAGNEWKMGLKLRVHASVDQIEFAKQYHKNKAEWDKAFAFLRDTDLNTVKPGKYLVSGDDVYAIITEAPSKTFEQSAWESHRKYIDLQYVIKGKEKIGVAALSTATVTKPYDETKDVANYTAEGKYYIAEPGTFFLFFPGDVHRPNIKVDGYDVVKKLVIKIRIVE
jgi:biofilm protein TabA